eukprot:3369882-Amphidinium_carterae.1
MNKVWGCVGGTGFGQLKGSQYSDCSVEEFHYHRLFLRSVIVVYSSIFLRLDGSGGVSQNPEPDRFYKQSDPDPASPTSSPRASRHESRVEGRHSLWLPSPNMVL